MQKVELKPVYWVASSKEELCSFPVKVRREIGYALHFAQAGSKHPSAKPLKGFVGFGVVEIVEDYDRGAYRAVYTTKVGGVIYVLLAFQKKSKTGIETPNYIMDLVKSRLKRAIELSTQNK